MKEKKKESFFFQLKSSVQTNYCMQIESPAYRSFLSVIHKTARFKIDPEKDFFYRSGR